MNPVACKESCGLNTEPRGDAKQLRDAANVLLVAIGFGTHSRAALRWADELAKSMGLRLRLVHAADERLPVDPLFPLTASMQSWHRESWLGALQEALQDWALRDVGVQIALNDVCVRFCEPAELILSEAARPDVKLVIMGGLPRETSAHNAGLPQAMLRRCPRPLLFVGPQGPNPIVVAATDCSDPTLPVLSEAYKLAGAIGDQVFVVHNVDERASQFAERIGMPLTPELADSVAQQSREWLEKTAVTDDVIISRESDNALGVLGVARTLGADLLVVGVKPEDKAQHGIAERILKETRRSVMFVPMARCPALQWTQVP